MTSNDIVILGVDWQPRALLRAQLLEEGFDAIATDTGPTLLQFIRPGSIPKLVIVDLQNLPNPRETLDALGRVMSPSQVLVLTALGTLTPSDIARYGFLSLARPLRIKDITSLAARLLGRR